MATRRNKLAGRRKTAIFRSSTICTHYYLTLTRVVSNEHDGQLVASDYDTVPLLKLTWLVQHLDRLGRSAFGEWLSAIFDLIEAILEFILVYLDYQISRPIKLYRRFSVVSLKKSRPTRLPWRDKMILWALLIEIIWEACRWSFLPSPGVYARS